MQLIQNESRSGLLVVTDMFPDFGVPIVVVAAVACIWSWWGFTFSGNVSDFPSGDFYFANPNNPIHHPTNHNQPTSTHSLTSYNQPLGHRIIRPALYDESPSWYVDEGYATGGEGEGEGEGEDGGSAILYILLILLFTSPTTDQPYQQRNFKHTNRKQTSGQIRLVGHDNNPFEYLESSESTIVWVAISRTWIHANSNILATTNICTQPIWNIIEGSTIATICLFDSILYYCERVWWIVVPNRLKSALDVETIETAPITDVGRSSIADTSTSHRSKHNKWWENVIISTRPIALVATTDHWQDLPDYHNRSKITAKRCEIVIIIIVIIVIIIIIILFSFLSSCSSSESCPFEWVWYWWGHLPSSRWPPLSFESCHPIIAITYGDAFL